MPRVGFEPTNPVFERAKIFHAAQSLWLEPALCILIHVCVRNLYCSRGKSREMGWGDM
jgi:hypothetical protein